MEMTTDIRQRYIGDLNRALVLRFERQVCAVTLELITKFNLAPAEARSMAEAVVTFVMDEIGREQFHAPSPF